MADEPRDVTAVLAQQHREVQAMAAELASLSGATDDAERVRAGELFAGLSLTLARHCVAEETQLHVAVHERDGDSEADLATHQHGAILEALQRLQGVPVGDPAFTARLDDVARAVHEHVTAQEDGLFEQLRRNFSDDERAELGAKVQALADIQLVQFVDDGAVPLPDDKVLGSVTELFDRVREASNSATGL